MPQKLDMLDISEPLLAAQKFKANQLSIKGAQQTISDRETMRNIRGKMVTKNSLGSPELDEMFKIGSSNAMSVVQHAENIRNMQDPKKVISEGQRNKLIRGFVMNADSPEKWDELMPVLTRNGVDPESIGKYSDNNRALWLGITGKIEKDVEAKLTELGVGDGLKQKDFVKPGEDPELLGKPFSGKSGSGGQKTADANFFNKAARQFFGSTVNPITGEFSALEQTTENQAAALADSAAQIFQAGGGKVNQNDAWNQAVQAAQAQGGQSGATQPGQSDQLNIRQWLNTQ